MPTDGYATRHEHPLNLYRTRAWATRVAPLSLRGAVLATCAGLISSVDANPRLAHSSSPVHARPLRPKHLLPLDEATDEIHASLSFLAAATMSADSATVCALSVNSGIVSKLR